MKLTGQTKIDFEKWYLIYDTEDSLYQFNRNLTESMQWGVFQDFADSVGQDLCIFHDIEHARRMGFKVVINGMPIFDGLQIKLFKTRQEARNAAIEKFNEIYNEQ